MDDREPGEVRHDDDVYGWSLRQAHLLRARRYHDVDVENVAEEIENLARSQSLELRSRYRAIAVLLLQASVEPERAARSRVAALLNERFDAQSCLRDNPSLKPRRAEIFDDAYRHARKLAAAETGLPLRTFPVEPPFTVDELSSEDFTPWQPPAA